MHREEQYKEFLLKCPVNQRMMNQMIRKRKNCLLLSK